MPLRLDYPELQGKYVRLEPLKPSHAAGLLEVGRQLDDWTYLSIPGLVDKAQSEEWVVQAMLMAERQEQLPYTICDAATGKPLGSSRYMAIRPKHHALEIGYTWLGRAAQRTPVNTETKLLMLSHAFESMGAYRVELKTDSRNKRSQRAIERIGGQREGLLRKHMVAQGGYHRDTIMYAITDDDWPAVKAGLMARL